MTPTYEYTHEIHQEHLRLAQYVVRKRYAFLSQYRDDLVQMCLIRLWYARPKYDPDKATYATFCIVVCVRACLSYMRSKDFRNHWDIHSLDFQYGDEFSVLDSETVATVDTYSYSHDMGYLISQIHAIVKVKNKVNGKPKHPVLEKIVDLLIQGLNGNEIADKLGYTRQNVSKHIQTLREQLHPRLIETGFIEKAVI